MSGGASGCTSSGKFSQLICCYGIFLKISLSYFFSARFLESVLVGQTPHNHNEYILAAIPIVPRRCIRKSQYSYALSCELGQWILLSQVIVGGGDLVLLIWNRRILRYDVNCNDYSQEN